MGGAEEVSAGRAGGGLRVERGGVHGVRGRSRLCWRRGCRRFRRVRGPWATVSCWPVCELTLVLTVHQNLASFPRVMTAPSESGPRVLWIEW